MSFLEAGPWLELEVTGHMAASHLATFLTKTGEGRRMILKLFAEDSGCEGMARPTFRLANFLN